MFLELLMHFACVTDSRHGPPHPFKPLKNDLLCPVQLWQELAAHGTHISISVVIFDLRENSSVHGGKKLHFFFTSQPSFTATFPTFLIWFQSIVAVSWWWYIRPVGGSWKQERLTTVCLFLVFSWLTPLRWPLLNLLSQCDFPPTLGHQAAVTVNFRIAQTSSPVSDWPSSCLLNLCCECQSHSYWGRGWER